MGRNGAYFTFGITGVTTALTFISGIILARALGPEGRGLMVAFILWPSLLSSAFFLSLNEATMYHIARARAGNAHSNGLKSKEQSLLPGVSLSLHIVMAGTLPFIVILLFPYTIGEEFAGRLSTLNLFALIFVPVTVLDLCFNAILQGRGNPRQFNLIRLVQPTIYVTGLVALLLLDWFRLETALVVVASATGVSVISGFALARFPRPRWNFSLAKGLFTTGRRIHGANLLLHAAAEADKILVLLWMDNAGVGIYIVALAVALAGGQLVTQSFTVLAYAKISGAENEEQQVALMSRFGQIAFLLLVLGNGLAALVLPWIIPMVFGVEFSAAVPVALVLLVMTTARGTRQVLDRALRAMLNVRLAMICEGIGLFSFFVLAPIGGNLDGLIGIAWAMAVSQLIAFGVMLLGVSKTYKVPVRDLLGLRVSTLRHYINEANQELVAFARKVGRKR